jgi:hypothetical protein
VIGGKKLAGDALVITGRYQNLSGQATYWSEGLAFAIGGSPRRCTINTCGIRLPKGDWRLATELGKPVVDFPKKRTVPPKGTVAFREAIALSAPVKSLRDLWVLPIYLGNNYYDLPYDYEQFVRLAAYLGKA